MSEAKPKKATPAQIKQWARQIPRWKIKNATLTRNFDFKNFYETMAFLNALAYIAHHQDHHPDLSVSYNKCIVSFSTHSAGGLTEKDFISAGMVDALK